MRSVTLKNWLLLASVSCGVGFGSTFLISRNLQQSALAGLGTVPAVAASMTILSRQRKEERNSNRQAELTSSLADLERREKLAREQLQQLDLDLGRQITLLSEAEAKKALAIDSVQQSDLELQRIRGEINRYSTQKEQLEVRVANLQHQLTSLRSEISEREIHHQEIEQQISRSGNRQNQLLAAVGELDRSIQDKQALLEDLDLDLGMKTALELEISSLLLQKQEHQDSLDELERVIARTGASISELNTTFTSRQRQLDRIVNELTEIEVRRQSAIDSARQSDLELAEIRDEISQQSVSKEQLAARVSDLQNQLEILSSEILERNTIRTEIEQQISRLVDKRNQLSTAVDDLDRSIQCKQALQQDINLDLEKERILEIEVSSLQRQKQDCQVSLDQLERVLDSRQGQLDRITTELAEIEARRQSVINSTIQSELYLENIQEEIGRYFDTKQELEIAVGDLKNHEDILTANLEEKECEIDRIKQQLIQLEKELKHSDIDQQQELPNTEAILSLDLEAEIEVQNESPEVLENNKDVKPYKKCRSLYSNNQLINHRQDFMNPQYTKKIWEEQILPFWLDRDKPKSQRFLGNVNISRAQSDRIIDIVGKNLQLVNPLTKHNISRRLKNLGQDWIKIFTFALSEYACYYSDEQFWNGLCTHWGISSNQTVHNTLREIAEDGIKLLGLVEATGGYRYVSTLWLQSGIPYQNLEQFAQLLKELTHKYTWNYLARDSAENLSKVILDLYNRKYPQGGTLAHLLKYRDPISGKIIRGLAKIAGELENRQIDYAILQDEHQRDNLLKSLAIDDEFFLRDWEAIVKILIPQVRNREINIINKQVKDIGLYLDEDSGNIQLILPEQSIWDSGWGNLRGSYCKISEAKWEENIPIQGKLAIPGLAIDITQVDREYSVRLENDRGDSLYTWSCEGIDEELPCLIFNAFSGEHLILNIDNPKIIGVEQIICFTPKEIDIVFDENIQLIDNYIPASIRGWKGNKMRLSGAKGYISIQSEDKTIDRTIKWQLQKSDEPRLTGVKLNSRKSSYLEIPTLWIPSCHQLSEIELKIRDNKSNSEIYSYKHTLVVSPKCVEISLDKWIDKVGDYTISIDRMNWHERFTVIPKYSVPANTVMLKPRVSTDGRIIAADSLPVSYQTSHEFNAQVIEIRGLWSLEKVSLILNHGSNENIERHIQADREGNLKIRLSEFSEFWSDSSSYYSLSYQRDGENLQSLTEAKLTINNIEWLWVDRELAISGLKPDYPYDLSCWNLLLPDREAIRLPLSLAKIESDTINTPLNLDTGIYYLRLLNGQEQVEAKIGFYYTGGQNDLPKAGSGNEDLENYCYTILGNEPMPDFQNAVERLSVSFDTEIVRSAIDSLKTSDRHLIPEWLDRNGLIEKLHLLSELN